MLQTTVGKILLKDALPEELHSYIDTTELDKKGLSTLFNKLAEIDPEKYKSAVSKLTRLGFEVSTRLGSTVALADLLSPLEKDKLFKEVEDKADELRRDIKDKKKLSNSLNDLYQGFVKKVEKDLIDIGVANNQTLAKVIKSGSRGSVAQYRQTVFSPTIVQDAKGVPLVDFPVKHSYAEGLSLPEYLTSSFGARAGAVANKLGVADSGYFSKQLSRATMTVKVEEHDCGTENGIEVPVSDRDSIGCYLAKTVGSFNRNNEVTSRMLNELKNNGVTDIIVRSPITCSSSKKYHTNAICQLCAGKREHGLPDIDSYIGITASSGLGESLAQSTLNTKHSAGSASGPSLVSGFKLINQLSNIPDAFKNNAAIVEHDGVVTEIKPGAQGGYYVHVGVNEYYVLPGFNVHVKVGDHVEAGDVISDGIVNPATIVKLKGIGEGRRYFAQSMKKAFDDAGMGGISRRNFEILAKAAIDHVNITNNEGLGNFLPGETASYQAIEKDYQPRHDSIVSRLDQSLGKHLEIPVLHYTIGTKITSKVIATLRKHNIESVTVNDRKPDFEPEMQRLLDVPSYEHDWMSQLYSTNLERKLIHAVNSGLTSNLRGASPIPGLAHGALFGIKKAEEEV